MTQEEINDGIKIIAEFDGWVSNGTHTDYKKHTNSGTLYSDFYELDYNSSLDSLMPVIKKFGELKFEDRYGYGWGKRNQRNADIDRAIIETYSAHEVFPLVVDAIKWYNSTKK